MNTVTPWHKFLAGIKLTNKRKEKLYNTAKLPIIYTDHANQPLDQVFNLYEYPII